MQRQQSSKWKGEAIDLVIIVMRMKFITMASCMYIWRNKEQEDHQSDKKLFLDEFFMTFQS